jgi:membrane protein
MLRPSADPGADLRANSGRGWSRWRAIVLETYHRADEDRLLAVAAGVVFYGLLALFPALTALVSLYALLSDPHAIGQHLSLLVGIVPAGILGIVNDELVRVSAKGGAGLGTAFVASLVLALWSANGGMKAVIDALNAVSEHRETRGFVRLNMTALGLTIGALLAVVIVVAAVVALPLLIAAFGQGATSDTILQLARWPILIVLILFGLATLYRFAPVQPPRWRLLSAGSVVATILWLAGSAALSVYLARFANYDATYGSLGAAIGLMMWMWMSSIVILLGAELNSVIDALPQEPKPI